jgi:hypothetical protein
MSMSTSNSNLETNVNKIVAANSFEILSSQEEFPNKVWNVNYLFNNGNFDALFLHDNYLDLKDCNFLDIDLSF